MRRLARGSSLALRARRGVRLRPRFDNTEPLAAQQWYLDQDQAWDFWATPPTARSRQGRRDRLGHRRRAIPSSPAASSPRSRSSAARRTATTRGTARSSPARSPRTRPTASGIAGLAFNARLIVAQGRRARRDGLAPGRGRGDPLGGRQGRAGDQPQPRRRARPARPAARHVLAARAGGGRVRVLEGRGRRRGGRQRAAVAGDAVGLRALSGGAAARDRRQRAAAGRLGARLLEPRRRLQRPRRAGRRRSSRRSRATSSTRRSRLRRRAVLRLRAVRVPRRDRHVVRGAAGLRGGGAAARRRIRRSPPTRSRGCSSGAPTTPRRRTGCAQCPVGRDRFTGWGSLDVLAALTMLTDGTPLPPPDRYEPNDDAGPVGARAAAAAPHDHGDARLLGRQRRRLPRLPAARPARSTRA